VLNMRKDLLAAALVLLLPIAAWAGKGQNVVTNPGVTSTAGNDINGFANNASASISSTNVFQELWGSNQQRNGCTIVNLGAHTMYVTEGIGVSGSTTAKAARRHSRPSSIA